MAVLSFPMTHSICADRSLHSFFRILSELPPVEAAIVKLFYLEQKQYKEISAELNIPENSIGPILHRARQRLKNK